MSYGMKNEYNDNDDHYRGDVDLVVKLLKANIKDSQNTYNALLDSAVTSLEERNAELHLIRRNIGALFSGPYMPNPERVLEALYPSRDDVLDFAQTCNYDLSEGLKVNDNEHE